MSDDLTPPPPPSSPAPAPAPTPSSAPVAAAPAAPQSYTGFAVTSWVLMALTCLIAVIPVIGFASWAIGFVVIPLSIVFAIIILNRGGKGQGILLLIFAVLLVPGWLLIAPMISTLVAVANASPSPSPAATSETSASVKPSGTATEGTEASVSPAAEASQAPATEASASPAESPGE